MIVENSILVDARSAALLAPWLTRIARQVTVTDGGTLDPGVVRIIAEFDRLGRAYRAASAERVGTDRNVSNGTPVTVPSWMTTTEVARHLGVTPRAVCRRIARGTLPATRVRGSWRIDAINLEDT